MTRNQERIQEDSDERDPNRLGRDYRNGDWMAFLKSSFPKDQLVGLR